MKTIHDRIREERLRLELTQPQLASLVGVSNGAISLWETGQTKPRGENLIKLANVFGVDPEYLTKGKPSSESKNKPFSDKIVSLVGQSGRAIPVISYIDAGRPREIVDAFEKGDGMELINMDDETAAMLGAHAFALRVRGNSMAPEINDGDTVVVDPDVPPRPGSIVVAKVNGDTEATLKKYRARGSNDAGVEIFELVPINNDYPTIIVNAERPGKIVGTVIEHRRKLR